MTPTYRVLVLLATFALAPTAVSQVCDGISPASGTALTSIQVASGLTRPILAVSPPGDLSRLFIVEQTGRIKILENGGVNPTPFLDISATVRAPGGGGGNEEGLLGLAFHPDYDTNGWLFVYYTNAAGNNQLVRYSRDTPATADPTSAQVVLVIPHPVFSNHNGGMIAFGPHDGYLYLAPGDGGDRCDSTGSAQDDSSLRGKMLRIDVDSLPYSIPPDNPFVGPSDPLDEIWAMGLRNPWRFSFDRGNGDLYIGDVGQGNWEEIDYQPASSSGGENYGWVLYEGTVCPPPACVVGAPPCVLPGHVPPVTEFSSSGSGGGACAVTGGYVYRGCRIPELHGRYFYGDFCADFVRSFVMQAGFAKDPIDHTAELAPGAGLTINELTAFGEDGRGELYILDRGVSDGGNGEVFQIVPVLDSMEISGINAVPLLIDTSFTWEDLTTTSPHPITTYQVYRHVGNGSGTFDCVHESPGHTWIGGDPFSPLNPSELFSYVITAENAAGDQTSPGESSSGVERTVSNSPCP